MCKIITFLNVEDVCGMRLICKNWHESVHNPGFITYHNENRNVEGRKRHILICKFESLINSSRIFGSMSNTYINVETWPKVILHPNCPHRHKLDILGIIYGILCLHNGDYNYNYNFFLNNPITSQHITIKPPLGLAHGGNVYVSIAFIILEK